MKLFFFNLLLAIAGPNTVMAAHGPHTIECELQSTDSTFISFSAELNDNKEELEEWNCIDDQDVLYDLDGGWERLLEEHIIISGQTIVKFIDVTVIPETGVYSLPVIVVDANSRFEFFDEVDTPEQRRLMVPTKGESEVLVVRITDASGEAPSMDATEISNRVFGTSTEMDSLKSQVGACSGNQLNLIPSTREAEIVDGVLELSIDVNVADFDGSQRKFLERVVNNMVKDKGYAVRSFGLVMYIMPDSTDLGFNNVIGYAYVNGVKSVYRGIPTFQTLFHEIGHNLGLAHSGLETEGNLNAFVNEYGDTTCQMGSSSQDLKCFNGAKSHKLGWYNQADKIGHEDLDREASWRGKIVGVHDYFGENYKDGEVAGCEGHRVVVNIGDLFIAFNRAESFTRDVPEANMVTVTENVIKRSKIHSMRKINGLLNENDVSTFETASGEKYSVMVCEISIDDNDPNVLDYADVIIYRNDDGSIIKSCDIESNTNACSSTDTVTDEETDEDNTEDVLTLTGNTGGSCTDDVKLVKQHGITAFPEVATPAVKIISQDESTVTVKLQQSWMSTTTIDYIFYEYKEDKFNSKCYEESDVDLGSVYDTITIQCNIMTPIAFLQICVADKITKNFLQLEDNGTIPKCCHSDQPEIPAVCYDLQINCAPECAENASASRRNLIRGGSFREYL